MKTAPSPARTGMAEAWMWVSVWSTSTSSAPSSSTSQWSPMRMRRPSISWMTASSWGLLVWRSMRSALAASQRASQAGPGVAARSASVAICSAQRKPPVHLDGDGRALTWGGAHPQPAADHLDALAHVDQAEMALADERRRSGQVEADPVVADQQPDAAVGGGERDVAPAGPVVLADVGERLLGDAVQHGLELRRQLAGEIGMDRALHTAGRLERRPLVVQRVDQAELVERRRAELGHQPPQTVDLAGGLVLEAGQQHVGVGRVAVPHVVAGQLQTVEQRGELLHRP